MFFVLCYLQSVVYDRAQLTLLMSGGAAARLTSGYQRLVRSGTTATSRYYCRYLCRYFTVLQPNSVFLGLDWL